MRDRYEPPTDPVPWPAIPPASPAWRAGEEDYAGPDWDPYYAAEFDGPADEARHQGLRRLSRLTWQATGLSAVAAVGFTVVFAGTAPAQTSAAAPAKPIQGPATASGTPSQGPTHTHHKHHKRKHHHEAGPPPAPGTRAPAAPAAPGSSAAPAPAPAHTLAPPTTAPAPPPPSSPPQQTTSSGSVAG
jgi:hypothetical protein